MSSLNVAVHWLRRALLALLLLTALVTPLVGGAVGVYLGLSAALASLVFAFDRTFLARALADWGVRAILLAFAILCAAFVLSAKTADDPMAFVDFLALPLIVPAYALLARYAEERHVVLVSSLALVGCLVALAVALLQVRWLGMERARGDTVSIFFADLSAMLAFLTLLGFLAVRSGWRWIFVAGHAAGLAACMAGGSRGALIGYAACYLCFAGFALLRETVSWPKRLLTVALIPILSMGLGVALFDVSRASTVVSVVGEVASTGKADSDKSATHRLAFWQGGIGAFLQSPVYGNGWWRRYDAAVPFMPNDGLDRTWSDDTSHLHNDIINFASAAGVMGVLAYLLLMAAPVISAWRSPRTQIRPLRLLAAFGLTAGYLAFGLTDTMFVFEVPKSMFVLLAAVVMAFMLNSPGKSEAPRSI